MSIERGNSRGHNVMCSGDVRKQALFMLVIGDCIQYDRYQELLFVVITDLLYYGSIIVYWNHSRNRNVLAAQHFKCRYRSVRLQMVARG